jgi:PLP dependent protein
MTTEAATSADTARRDVIRAGLERVEHEVALACQAAGRERASVRLVAVSKFKPASDIRLAYELGVRDFGENYVQELSEKQAALADLTDVRWHLIGHVQRNKARALVAQPPLLHTLDDVRLAEDLGRRLSANGQSIAVLIQVNLAVEEQKAGCTENALHEVCERVARCPGISLQGLMLIPPAVDDPELSRPHFRRLAELAREMLPPGAELSMGMSQDFHVAITEGATLVRVGTAIFGGRG